MKRIFVLLIAALLLLVPLHALADGETSAAGATPSSQSPTPAAQMPAPPATETPAASASAPAGLSIDSLNVYDGMDQAYMDGYTPRVKSGKATIVLPLVASGDIQGSSITVTPGLGDPSSAPFVFKNYQKAVKRGNNTVKGGGTISSYLVRFDLPLKKGRVNGAYPVTIAIEARAADGAAIEQSYTWYVVITDGKDPNAVEPTPKPATPESQPKLIISAYSLNPAMAEAGKALAVTVTLTNTSDDQAVRDVKVTAFCDSQDFALKNDSNTFFLDKIAAGGTADIVLKYEVGLKAAVQQYNISLAMEYDNEQAVTLSATGAVALSVSQPLRMQMEAPKIASSVNAGDTLPLSFQVMNLGRGAVYNVRCTLDAPGFLPTGVAFLGNMEAGSAKTGEMDVFIGTKDMTEGHEKDGKYGPTSGTVMLIYEDEAGREYTEKREFTSMINEPVIAPASTVPEEEPQKAGQWWLSVLIGAAVAAALAILLISRGRRVKRHEKG